MSTYLLNSVPTSSVSPSGLGNAGALISGFKWGGALGSGVDLTFSFLANTAYHITPYGPSAGIGEFADYFTMTATEKAGVTSALAKWSQIANVNFTQTVDNATTVGDLRFGITGVATAQEDGHAYYPSDHPWGGDVWLSAGNWHTHPSTAVAPGTYDYLTLLHEIGHALGLKHPFQGSPTLPVAFDSYSFTVMSYSAKAGLHSNYASFYPTTPMYYDIVAIQDLYGARPHNNGNNTYTFSSTRHYWQTIDDSGGTDTITVTGAAHTLIDLRTGHWSQIGLPITFSNNTRQFDTVMMGPRTLIENAHGGAGADRIIGNSVHNVLIGGAGNDRITGYAGNDRFVFAGHFGRDAITDFDAGAALTDVIAIAHTLLGSFNAVKHHASVVNHHVVIAVDASDKITLGNVHHIGDLSANDFVFI